MQGGHAEPSAYDLWLDRRLATGRDPTWLAEHSIFAAATVCRHLGLNLVDAESLSASGGDLAGEAQAAGFGVLSRGPQAFRAALDALAAAAAGSGAKPHAAFGSLHEIFRKNYADFPEFDGFRDILRDCVLDHWPFAACATVLGKVQQERRLQSVLAASQATGADPIVIQALLVEAGALAADDPRSFARQTFDARRHGGMIAEIPQLVCISRMCAEMGASKREFECLEADGVLHPVIRNPLVNNRWRLSDGLHLVEELLATACPVARDNDAWETLQAARRRMGMGLRILLEGLRRGMLRAGQQTGRSGYAALLIAKENVDCLARAFQEVQPERVPGALALSAFSRSIGLRDRSCFRSLVEDGHTPASAIRHLATGPALPALSEAHVAQFHRRFVTVPTLAAELGLHRNTVRTCLRDAGVPRFSPGGKDYGNIYLRQDFDFRIFLRR